MLAFPPNSDVTGYAPPAGRRPLAVLMTAVVMGLAAQSLLAAWPMPDPVKRALPRLTVALVQPPPPPPPPVSPPPKAPVMPVAAVKLPPPPRARPLPAPPARFATHNRAADAPMVNAVAAPVAVVPTAPGPIAVRSEPPARAVESPPAPPPPPSAAVSKSIRDAYAAKLWQRIAAQRPRGVSMPGTARVGFTVSRNGALSNVTIVGGSGNAMLDQLALRTVRAAGPMPRPPAEIEDGALRFVIPFSFS